MLAAMIAAFSGCGGGSHAVPNDAARMPASGPRLSLSVPPPPPSLAAPPRAALLRTTPAQPDRSGRRSLSTAGHPAFFAGEVALSNGVYYLQFANGTVFGYYSYLPDPRYIYHFDLGYEYVADPNDGKSSAYLYDFASSHWWYTSPTFAFPYVFDFSRNAFLYYYPDTSNAGHYTAKPRYFFDFAIGQIITLPGAYLTPSKLTFAGGTANTQNVGAYASGSSFYALAATADASGCAGIATATSAPSYSGDSVTVTPGQPGSCTLIVIDANGGRSSVPITVTTPPMGSITEFAHTGAHQQYLARDPSGNLWSTDVFSDTVVKRTTGGTETVIALPAGSHPTCIRSSAAGELWFTEYGTNQIGRITPAGNVNQVTHYTVPTANAQPSCIVEGPDGAFWFTEAGHAAIGRITTAGAFTEYPAPTTAAEIAGITVGPDGNLWFTAYPANKIGRITPAGAITEYSIPVSDAGPTDITAGPDGALWFTEMDAGLIGRVTVTGTMTEYARPSTTYDQPNQIIAGPDGNLWYTDFFSAKIGRISPSGVVDEFPTLNRQASPGGIVAGADGALWFTQAGSGKIGRIHP